MIGHADDELGELGPVQGRYLMAQGHGGPALGAYIGAGGVVELPVSVHAIAGRKP